MSATFVTATGTDIGKTFVTAAIARMLRDRGRMVEALKPVISGFSMATLADSDTGVLLAATGREVTPENAAAISPWRFAAPLSPDMAARREGQTIDFDRLTAFSRERIAARRDVLLIEGAGGVMTPLDDAHTMVDWVAALDIPVLLIAGNYLGTISHTLTALEAITRRGLSVVAVVVSESPDSAVDLDETAASIRRYARPADVVTLPRHDGAPPNRPSLAGLVARL